MARRLIGTGTTDSNGKITVTYTGTGAGELQIVAVSGEIESEAVTLKDYLCYDHAVTGDKSTDWTTGSAVSVNTTDGGTILSVSSGTLANSVYVSTKALTDDFELSVWFKTGGESMRAGVTDGTNRIYYQTSQTADRLYRIRRLSSTITLEYSTNNGETWNSINWSGSLTDNTADLYFFLGAYHSQSEERTLTYHDLKAYHI